MKIVARILLAAVAYVAGTIISGVIAAVAHLPQLALPPGTTEKTLFGYMLLAAPLLAAGLVPLALGMKGAWGKRMLALAFLVFICVGLNTVIEARIFSSLIGNAALTLTLQNVLPAILLAAVLTWPRTQPSEAPPMMVRFAPVGWGWRVLLAWIAFPVIYFIFGMAIAPIVMPYYRAGVAGLTIPPFLTLVPTLFVRSALFLAATLPVLMLWSKSRLKLFLALGLAHAMMVGIFGLVQGVWMPMVLRVTHSVEITFDSFAYAGVLVLLFTRKAKAKQAGSAGAATAGQ